MPPGEPSPTGPANPQKARRGLSRLWHATGYSLQGLRAGWGESAFRQEALAALVRDPATLEKARAEIATVRLAKARATQGEMRKFLFERNADKPAGYVPEG